MFKFSDGIKKGFSILVIFVYVFVILFQSFPFINLIDTVKAESEAEKVNLALILVDGAIYNDIKSDISWYAKDYIQAKNKNYKTIVLPIDTNKITADKIHKLIENLYFNGEKDKISFLKGIILIGNIPLPVVYRDGYVFSSIYPYVDIVKPTFYYDKSTGYFKYSGQLSDVELFHGIIKFNNIQDYHKYFKKLKQYAQNPASFVDKKLFYDNFISAAESFNSDMLKYYLNKFIFAENIITRKITPLLMDYFSNNYKKTTSETFNQLTKQSNNEASNIKSFDDKKLDNELAKKLGMNISQLKQAENVQKNYQQKIDSYFKRIKEGFNKYLTGDSTKLSDFWSIPTKSLEKALKGFTKSYSELFGNQYVSNIDNNIKATSRYGWTGTNSTLNLLELKDTLSLNYINKLNKFLEKKLDDKIEQEKYYLTYPIMEYYISGDNYNNGIKFCEKEKYEVFFFGKNAKDVNSLEDIHVFRGTWGNYTGLNILKLLPSRNKKSSISYMNGLFNLQTRSIRGFNTLKAKSDGDHFKISCSKKNGACLDLGRYSNSEQINQWAKRIYGGYSPLNLNINQNSVPSPIRFKFNYENYKQAWHPSYASAKDGTLFDLAGTNFNWDKQDVKYTDSIKGIKKYASVWRTEYYNMGIFDYGLCNEKYQHGANKVGGYYYDYFSDFNNLFKSKECDILGGITKRKNPEIIKISNNEFVLKKYKDVAQTCDFITDKEIYYKIVDTRIKHTSPTKEQFSGFSIATYLRPVDSENYISFLGVGGGTVKFKYPDLFAVEVYKEENGNLVLKTPNEILSTIKKYLKNLVRDYNEKLQNQLNTKDNYYNTYKKAFDNVPFDSVKPHSYNLLPEDYFINLIGEKKLSQIAEMLYYLNLGWSKKPSFSNLKQELDYLYLGFDISEKLDYLTNNYLNSEDPYNIGDNDISKSKLNFPSKAFNGYEAGIIVSENNDSSISSKNKNLFNSQNYNISSLVGQNSVVNPKNKKKECGRTLGEAVILWEWPSAFMCRLQETLKKPFKISSTFSCSVGPTPSEFLDQLGLDDTDRENYLNPNKVLEKKYKQEGKFQEYEKFKSQIDSNVIVKPEQVIYSADIESGSIIINNYANNDLDLNIDTISVWSAPLTGNCLYFKVNNNYLNSCEGFTIPSDKWKLDFYFYNPETQEGRYYSYKAGQRRVNIKFCNSDNICYVKQVVFSKSPGDLKYVEIKPFSDVMIYGGENPVIINGYDSAPNKARYVNKVTYTTYNYKLYLEPGIGVIKTSLNTRGAKSLDYNFSSSQKLLIIKSNTKKLGLTGFNLVLKLDPIWETVLSGRNNILKEKKVRIGIAYKEKLLDSEVNYDTNYQIPKNPDDLFKKLGNGIKVIDKNKLWKIHIKPIVYGRTLKTPVEVKSTDHFIVGTFQEFSTTISGEKVSYEDFVKTNKFLITGDNGIDIYLMPTFKVGNYKINIHIPGIKQDYVISNKIIIEGNKDTFNIKKLYIKLNKYKVNPGEKITGKIFAVDDFGNIYKDLSGINIQTSDKIRVKLSGNSLEIRALKSGYIKASIGDIETTIPIQVNNTFLPLDGKISVMYLSLFGYDWGKYASSIMSKSDKNLAITTFLHKQDGIKQYQYIIGENLKNIGDFSSILQLNSTGFLLNFGNLKLNYKGKFNYSVKSIDNPELINQDGIYYVKEVLDDYIKENYLAEGNIYVNGKKIIDFSNLQEDINTKIIYSSSLTKKYNIAAYEVFYNGKKVGTLYFKGKVINVNNLSVDKPLFTKVLNIGSTNGLNAFGVSLSSDSYKTLIKYNIKQLGFRGKFKNVSLFASGLPVGLATKDFANELIINYGDPFLKRISRNDFISKKYPSSNLDVSKSYGYKIYSSVKGGIKKVVPLDFNNDGEKDLLILYSDSKIRLLKNYKGDFENLGNLMILDGNIKDISAGDVDGDGYEDVFAIFSNGSIRVYKNNHGEFDVNGFPVCLNLAGSDPEKLKYDQLFFYDMNNDGKTDIVTNDLASNIKIFFGPSYLSNSSISCDTNFKSRLKEQLVKSYSMKVKKLEKFVDAGYIYWEGLKDTSSLYQQNIKKIFKNKNLDSVSKVKDVDTNTYYDKVKSQTTTRFAFQDIPKKLGPNWLSISGDYVSFKKIEFLSGSDPIKVYKTMEDLNGGVLMPGDKIKVTLHIENPYHKRLTYLEVLKGPFDVISVNDRPVLTGFNGISSGNIFYPLDYPYFLFKVDNVDNSFSLDYYVIFRGDSSVKIKVGDWDNNNYGEIKVFSINGCIKGYDYFKGQNSSIPMGISYSYIDLKDKLKSRITNTKQDQQIQQVIDDIKNDPENLSNIEKYVDLEGGIWSTTNGGLSANLEINGPDLSALKAKINGILNGLCNGFSFGKSSCGGLTIPCNWAFLAPGIANACGCPLGIKPGLPIFWYPGTIRTPIPIAVPNGAMSPIDNIPMGGVFPSIIRIYLTPTLTAGLGFSACFGPYIVGMTSPVPPFGAIAGNCVVVAADISSSCSEKNKNGDEVLDDWMNDLDNGLCSSIGDANSRVYPSSPIKAYSYDNFISSNISSFNAGVSIAGQDFISFNTNAHRINSLEDAEQLLEGGVPINLNIKMGSLKGIFSCIIKKWLNKQIQYIISQLTSMTIYITYPQFNGSLMEGFEEERFKQLFNDLDESLGKLSDLDLGFGEDDEDNNLKTDTGKKVYEKLGKYLPSGKGLRELNETLDNPFSKVEKFFDEVPLVNVRLKTVVINVPWIGKDELERQISYLENWLQRNKKKIDERKKYPENLVSVDVNKFVNSVQKNIEILNKYRNFPLQLYKYLHLIDTYLSQISCILNKYFDMLIGWIIRQSKIFEKWVDAIVALINIFRTWQLLIDISVSWKSSCGKCRMDTGDLYDCVLSLLCPSLPVLPIPPFKIPDIFIDFSHINLGIDIILPKIKIYPIPIGVFTLPDLPDVGVKFTLPKLPLLPEPPTLPDLPALPAMPVLELPNLPPPPKIPELLPSLQAALNIFKIIGYFWCIIKNGIGLVAEWNVSTRVEQLTARHNRIFPFDFINIDFPVLPFKGFDVRVDGYVNFKLEFSQLYDIVKNLADSINQTTKSTIGDMLELNAKWNQQMQQFNNGSLKYNFQGKAPNKFDYLHAFVINKKPLDTKIAKFFLNKELEYFLSQKNENYLITVDRKYFSKAKEILKDNLQPVVIKSNEKSVQDIKNKVFSLIQEQSSRLDRIEKVLKDMENGKKIDFDSDIFVKKISSNLVSSSKGKDVVYKFSTRLFTTSNKVLDIIKNSKAPRQYYLEMYSKVLNKVNNKLEGLKYKKGKRFIYEDIQLPVKQSLEVIKQIDPKLAYANNSSTLTKPILPDPSQAIRGLYMKGEDGDYYNVLADKNTAKKVRQKGNYFEYDFNDDGKKDLLWYDSSNIYIKYSYDEPNIDGQIYTKAYIYNNIISNFETVVDDDGYIEIQGEKFRSWSKKYPVNTLSLNGQSFDDITLKWKKSDRVNAYYILYSSRIDILNEIEKKYNYSSNFNYEGKEYKTYAIVLYDKNLGNMNEALSNEIIINGHRAENVIYVPTDLNDNLYFVLDKAKLFIKDKWKYFRIYTANLNLEIKQLNILSSYSNQEVGGEQIIVDDKPPFVEPVLIRIKGHEADIDTGVNLVGYINTAYKLKVVWKDNIALKYKAILNDKKELITTDNFINVGPEVYPTKKVYYLYGVDYADNEILQKVTIDIKVPDITLEEVNGELGFTKAKVSKDMDKTAIRFGIETKNGVEFLDSINGKDIFTGSVYDTIFTGSVFNLTNTLNIYDSIGSKLGEINIDNGLIKLDKQDYKVVGIVRGNTLHYVIYNPEKLLIFDIKIPSIEIIDGPNLSNQADYELKQIDYNGYKWCIINKADNKCMIYISKNGNFFIDSMYEGKITVKYIPRGDYLKLEFYKDSIPSDGANGEKIMDIVVKEKSLITK